MTSSASDKRTERIEVRLTPEEKQAMKSMADAAGMSASSFLRASAIGDGYEPPQVNAKQLNELLHQIKKLGTNMNQIAYRLNRGDDVSHSEISAALARHRKAALDLERLIDDARGPR